MRKSIWCFTALFLCAVIVLTVSVGLVAQGKAQIVVSETTLAGDPAAARGLQVQTTLNLDQQMFWETEYAVEADPTAKTEYRFFQQRQNTPYERRLGEPYINLLSMNFGISGSIGYSNRYGELMMRPVEALAADTAAGETKTAILRLADYYDWYPLELDPVDHGIDSLDAVERDHAQFLTETFQIPVPDTVFLEVMVQKDQNGDVVAADCNPYREKEELEVWMFSNSVVTEDWACILPTGNVDFSRSQLGYGIYRIPISWHDRWENYSFSDQSAHMELEQMVNVFPLDPGRSEDYHLLPSVNETEMLLFEKTENGMTMQVLETDDFSVRQQLELGCSTMPTVWIHEDLVILGSDIYDEENSRLQVLQRKNGQYHIWLDTPCFRLGDGGFIEPVFGFDGQRLAMATFADHYATVRHQLAVYDQTGLLYAGDFTYDSDALPEPPKNWNWVDPLQVSWTGF